MLKLKGPEVGTPAYTSHPACQTPGRLLSALWLSISLLVWLFDSVLLSECGTESEQIESLYIMHQALVSHALVLVWPAVGSSS